MVYQLTKETAKEVISDLPAYYPRHEDSPNFKAFLPPAEQAARLEDDIDDVRRTLRVQDQMATDLTVASGADYIVGEDERLYRDTVTVEGTLHIEGELLAKELTTGPNGEVIVNGELIQGNNLDEFIQRLEKLGAMVQVYPYDGESISHYRARIIAEFSLMTAEGTFDDMLTVVTEVLDVSDESVVITDRVNPGEIEIELPARGVQNTSLSDSELGEIFERVIPASYSLDALQRGTFTYITPSQYDLNDHDASKGYDGLDTNGDPKDNGGTYAGLII
jgi:hypothetical protein